MSNAEHKPSVQELSDEDVSNATGGAFNAFASFSDIKGDSTDKDHKDWIA